MTKTSADIDKLEAVADSLKQLHNIQYQRILILYSIQKQLEHVQDLIDECKLCLIETTTVILFSLSMILILAGLL